MEANNDFNFVSNHVYTLHTKDTFIIGGGAILTVNVDNIFERTSIRFNTNQLDFVIFERDVPITNDLLVDNVIVLILN